jgi:hypothetical protein
MEGIMTASSSRINVQSVRKNSRSAISALLVLAMIIVISACALFGCMATKDLLINDLNLINLIVWGFVMIGLGLVIRLAYEYICEARTRQ